MKISEKKAEILKLVEQLRPVSGQRISVQRGDSIASPRRGMSVPAYASSDRLAKRREDLADIQRRRDKIGIDLLETRLLNICQALEVRISKIEEVIRKGVPQKQVPSPEAASSGTTLASSIDEMIPDISAEIAAPAKPAARLARIPSTPPDTEAAPGQRSYFLNGTIKESMLPDILQLISSNDKTGVFAVEYADRRINLFFRDGQLYHAEGDGMNGQSAFFAAMAFPEGKFFFDETDNLPEDKTIDGNTQFMILEALRQIDEERSGE